MMFCKVFFQKCRSDKRHFPHHAFPCTAITKQSTSFINILKYFTNFISDAPTDKEMVKLRYITAMIYEGLRIRPPAPLGVPHATEKELKFHGYTISKGTTVLGDCFSAHHNAEDFPDPHLFKPERFLNEQGGIINSKQMLSFGIGKN